MHRLAFVAILASGILLPRVAYSTDDVTTRDGASPSDGGNGRPSALGDGATSDRSADADPDEAVCDEASDVVLPGQRLGLYPLPPAAENGPSSASGKGATSDRSVCTPSKKNIPRHSPTRQA